MKAKAGDFPNPTILTLRERDFGVPGQYSTIFLPVQHISPGTTLWSHRSPTVASLLDGTDSN